MQSGDHILQIGEVNLRGLGSEQVATVLRQAGVQVRMVVARPFEPTSADFQNNLGHSASVVQTKFLTDPEELDRQLVQNGYGEVFNLNRTNNYENDTETEVDINGLNYNEVSALNCALNILSGEVPKNVDINSLENFENGTQNFTLDVLNAVSETISNSVNSSLKSRVNSIDVNVVNIVNVNNTNAISPDSFKHILLSPIDIDFALPETKRITVELNKNEYGLGITVAGYVCEREDLCGIFIKSINEGSGAYKCKQIEINDRIVEVNGISLLNLTNHEAVEKLKQAGDKVLLTLERYLRGPKFESLQEALACQEARDISPASPSATTLSWIPIDAEVKIFQTN